MGSLTSRQPGLLRSSCRYTGFSETQKSEVRGACRALIKGRMGIKLFMPQTIVDNRYTRSKPLGSGGMAEVYLAHDEVLDRDVAIKVLKEQHAGNEEFVRLFRREARSAARLNHRNTRSVYAQAP